MSDLACEVRLSQRNVCRDMLGPGFVFFYNELTSIAEKN